MEPDLLIAIRLSKEGFGSPEAIRNSPAPYVLAMLNYATFLADFNETATEMNREGSK